MGQYKYVYNIFTKNFDLVNNITSSTGSTSGVVIVGAVNNYSSLPVASGNTGNMYLVLNSQGTAWLPGSLGGTFYAKGVYYSNGTSWSLAADVPYQATQSETNSGTTDSVFITPAKLSNYNGSFLGPIGVGFTGGTIGSTLDVRNNGATSSIVLKVKGVSGQTGHLVRLVDSSDSTLFSVASSGTVTLTNAIIGASTQNVFHQTSTTVNAFGASTGLTLGYINTNNSVSDIIKGATSSGNSKIINIGNGGLSGSTTVISLGTTSGGTSNINLYGLTNITDTTDSTGTTTGSLVSLGGAGFAKNIYGGGFYTSGSIGVGLGSINPVSNLEVANSAIYSTRAINNATTPGQFWGRKSRGTLSSPSAVLSGDQLAAFYGAGAISTGWVNGAKSGLIFSTLNDWTTTDNSTKAEIWLTPSGSTTFGKYYTFQTTGVTVPNLSVSGDILLTNPQFNNSYLGNKMALGSFTGLISGGYLTVNSGNNALFNISGGTGQIIDYSNMTSPVIINVSWDDFIGVTPTYLSTFDVSYVLITSGGTVLQTSTFPTQLQRRNNIFIGRLSHSNRTSISFANAIPDIVGDLGNNLYDFYDALGQFNITGNAIGTNGTNLTFVKSAGTMFTRAYNYTTIPVAPNIVSVPASSTPASFAYRTQSGGTSTNVTNIDPTSYDVGGVVTAVPGGGATSTIQRVFLFPDGNIRIQYGQQTYTSLANAIAGISTDSFVLTSSLQNLAILIGYIVVSKNCTDLTDTTRARIIKSARFDSGTDGGSVSVTTLQGAYNNSLTPEIVTDSTRGALTLQRGSSSDSDNILEIQNGTGSTVSYTTGQGNSLFNTVSGNSFVKIGGLSTQFLKADGSIDNNTYLTGVTNLITGTTNQIVATPTGSTVQISLNNNPHISGSLFVGSTSSIQWGDNDLSGTINGFVSMTSNGVFRFGDSSGGGNPRLILGSAGANTGVSLLRNTNGLDIKNGDNTAFNRVTASGFTINGGTSSQFLVADGTVNSNVVTVSVSGITNNIVGFSGTNTITPTPSYLRTGASMGINTSGSPRGIFEIAGSSSAYDAYLTRYADTSGFNLIGIRARNTEGSPGSLQTNDRILTVAGRGWGLSAYSLSNRVSVNYYAGQNWDDGSQGTYITFGTTPNGSTTQTENVIINSTSITAPSFVVSGGTSSQFLKANGSVDSNTYIISTGITNTISFWNTSTNLTGSTNLTYSNNILNLGSVSGGNSLLINGATKLNTSNYFGISGNTNTYVQSNIQNGNNGSSASSDYIATADNGNDTTNYIDMGINSSAYSDSGYTATVALDGYLLVNGGNLVIGTTTSKSIKFITGGSLTGNTRGEITSSGVYMFNGALATGTYNFKTNTSGYDPNGIVIQDQTTTTKRLILGYSSDNNYGFISSINSGTAYLPTVHKGTSFAAIDSAISNFVPFTSPQGGMSVLMAVGDTTYSGGKSQFSIRGATANNNKRLDIGFDTTGNFAWIESTQTNVGYNPLVLNNGGGAVIIAGSTDNGNKFQVNGDSLMRGTTANKVLLTMVGASSQSADYLQIIDSSLVAKFIVNSGGTVTTGIWNGSVIKPNFGGTGVANATGSTITLGGALTVSGAFSTTLTVTNVTSVTLPTSGTLSTLDGIETLTNKTLTTPNISTIKGTLTTDVDGATITFNKNTSDFHQVTLAGNRTLALSNMAAGDRIVLRLVQDATGSRTVTWFSTIKWVGGTPPILTTTASKADVFGFLCTSTGNYDGFIIGQNI